MKRDGRKFRLSPGTCLAVFLFALIALSCAFFFIKLAGSRSKFSREDVLSALPQGTPAAVESSAEPAEEPPAAATPEPETEQTADTQEAEETMSFVLAAAGSVGSSGAICAGAQNGGEYDFTDVFSGVSPLFSDADLSIATLACTVADAEPYTGYNAPAEILEGLGSCGIRLVSLAAEHALDNGRQGLERTAEAAHRSSMMTAGIQAQGGNWMQLSINGIRIAVFACTYGISDEGKAAAPDDLDQVCVFSVEELKKEIIRARAEGAQFVVVLPHWGVRNRTEVSEDIREEARELAEAGADLILGTHPNVVQETERLSVVRSDGLTYETVVCYSLGNLLTDSRTSENSQGLAVRIRVEYDPQTRRISMGTLACTPVYIACTVQDERTVYRAVDTENAEAVGQLEESEQQKAAEAAENVRKLTGQKRMEEEGEG